MGQMWAMDGPQSKTPSTGTALANSFMWIAATLDCNSGNRWQCSGPLAQFSLPVSSICWQRLLNSGKRWQRSAVDLSPCRSIELSAERTGSRTQVP